jgi:histidinol-phosphate aminotransferase
MMNKAAVTKIFEFAPRVSAAVAAQPAYAPGEQPGGEGWIKLNTNENPFPPSPRVVEAIRRELGGDGAVLRLYPSPASAALREAVARFHGVDVACAFAGNGSDDVLNLLVRAFSGGGLSAGMLEPSYSLYPVLAGLNAAAMIRVPVSLEGDFDVDAVCRCGANIFFLTNPNAPLGVAFAPEKIAAVLARFDGLLVVDEAYAPFARADATGLLGEFPNLVITRTFSKAYALAGMRAGYALAHRDVVAVLDKVRDSYNVDRLAQVAAVAALGDRAYYDGVIARIREVRDATADALRSRGWRVLPSEANFLMAAPPAGADVVFRFLKERRVLVRHFPQNPLTAPFLRISIGSGDEMLKFLNIIDQWTP